MERKLYKCKYAEGCETEQAILSKGLCNFHRMQERKAEGTLPVYQNKIKPFTCKSKERRTSERSELPTFFQDQIEILSKNPISQQSGKAISTPSSLNICHILPKRKGGGFPSVQSNPENVLFLTWDEHTRFDTLLDRRDYSVLEQEFDVVWPIAIKKVRKLIDVVTERNKVYFSLEEYLYSKSN